MLNIPRFFTSDAGMTLLLPVDACLLLTTSDYPYSDSRVSEGLIFSPLPGTIFTERNVANQYLHEDIGTVAALGFGVRFLKVGHVIVMGHYGCGGVKAATHPGPANPDRVEKTLNTWIDPIRSLYHNSTRYVDHPAPPGMFWAAGMY